MTGIVAENSVLSLGALARWLPSSERVITTLIIVFCGTLVLYPMIYLVVLSVNVGDPQTFPPEEYGTEHYEDLLKLAGRRQHGVCRLVMQHNMDGTLERVISKDPDLIPTPLSQTLTADWLSARRRPRGRSCRGE